MPELMVDFITSLDGYGAAEGWPGWWGLEGPEYLAWLEDQPEAEYTVLMGANTYRLMYGLARDGEPGTDVLAGFSKIVFSATLEEPLSWPNTRLISGDAVEAVGELKETGMSMRTIGSLTLCRSLLNAGVVDRFRLVVFPVITGSSGRDRIYDGYPDVLLEMIDSRTFDSRLQLVRVQTEGSGRSSRFQRGARLGRCSVDAERRPWEQWAHSSLRRDQPR
jgi:dihydrofolate reductase